MKKLLTVIFLGALFALSSQAQPVLTASKLGNELLRSSSASAARDVLGIVSTNAAVVVPPDGNTVATNEDGTFSALASGDAVGVLQFPLNTNGIWGVTTVSGVQSFVDNLGFSRKFSIGQDFDENEIYAYAWEPKHPSRTVIVLSSVHGFERNSTWQWAMVFRDLISNRLTDRRCAYILDNVRLIWVPVVNKWGFEHVARTNHNGVDINRNFGTFWDSFDSEGEQPAEKYKGPYAYSEPETRALTNLLYTYSGSNLVAAISAHANFAAPSGTVGYSVVCSNSFTDEYDLAAIRKSAGGLTDADAMPQVLPNPSFYADADQIYGLWACDQECVAEGSLNQTDFDVLTAHLSWACSKAYPARRSVHRQKTVQAKTVSAPTVSIATDGVNQPQLILDAVGAGTNQVVFRENGNAIFAIRYNGSPFNPHNELYVMSSSAGDGNINRTNLIITQDGSVGLLSVNGVVNMATGGGGTNGFTFSENGAGTFQILFNGGPASPGNQFVIRSASTPGGAWNKTNAVMYQDGTISFSGVNGILPLVAPLGGSNGFTFSENGAGTFQAMFDGSGSSPNQTFSFASASTPGAGFDKTNWVAHQDGSLVVPNLVIPEAVSVATGVGITLWNSNGVLYAVSATKTNVLSDLR